MRERSSLRTEEVNQIADFGRLVRRLREREGLSQGELARLLEMDPSYLSRIERGKAKAPRNLVGRLLSVDSLSLTADDELELEMLSRTPRSIADPMRVLQAIDLTQSILSGAFGPRVLWQMGVDPQAKRAIARYLAAQLANTARAGCRHPLVLDSGTTVAFVAHALSEGPGKIGAWDFYTSNILASLYLVDSGQVYLLGGRLDSGFGATLGSETIRQTRTLLDKLGTEERTTCAPTIGMLSCLAFDPMRGPYARLARTDTGKPLPSAHAELKAVFLETIPNLIVLVTPEKLLRPIDRHWATIISPIQNGERDAWAARLERSDHLTHVVMTLGTKTVRHREIVLKTSALLTSGTPPFRLTENLFDSDDAQEGNAFLTVLDETNAVALLSRDLWPDEPSASLVRSSNGKTSLLNRTSRRRKSHEEIPHEPRAVVLDRSGV